MSEEKCPTCGRRRAAEHVGDEICEETGSQTCALTCRVNSLVAVARKLARTSGAERPELLAALVVIESAAPSKYCPLCGRSVVRDTFVAVHFASTTDARPCAASFTSVVGGIWLKK